MHGKESGPSGAKIVALAELARSHDWDVASLDYSHTVDPAARLKQLLGACADVRVPRLLVGSSMGGWVAAEAAARVGARGVFLMAPALGMPGYPSQAPQVPATFTEIVHAWDDEVIPCEHAIRFARLRQCTLHLVQGDHRLNTRIPLLRELFGGFLLRCAADHAR
jgi:predicted esterase YcpF (UPF0227 family)